MYEAGSLDIKLIHIYTEFYTGNRQKPRIADSSSETQFFQLRLFCHNTCAEINSLYTKRDNVENEIRILKNTELTYNSGNENLPR